MDVVKCAKELAKAIQQSEEFVLMEEARKKSDSNIALQEKISNFNLKKIAYNHESTRESPDNNKLEEIDKEVRNIYQAIMQEDDMINYSEAKAKVDVIMKKVEYVLAMALRGQNPDEIEVPETSGCTGSCSTCSGCH